MKPLCSICLCLAMAATTWSATLHVPGTYPTIQEAIDASASGDTVLVAPGTYLENIDFKGKEIIVGLGTVIDGSNPKDPDFASCVLIISGEGPSTVLDGFTLTGGKGTVWQDIHNKLWYREGGGILIELSSPTIQNNLIIDNEAIDKTGLASAGGGGIRSGDGDPMIRNNVIYRNQGRYGGGIVMNYATGTIMNNLICGNHGGKDYGGGGIWTYAGDNTIVENNTIVDNTSGSRGGGMRVWSTTVTGRNNIIWGNEAATQGDQIFKWVNATVDLTYSDVQGGWTGTGNIDAHPLFGDDNCIFCPYSPCIDAGDSDPACNDPEDPGQPGQAEYPSMGGLRNDMGAYGGPLRSLFALSVALPLKCDSFSLSASGGGIVNFSLDAGSDNGNRNHLLLGSASGILPGHALPGGYAMLPLNWDDFTNLVMALLNTSLFHDFLGKLDASGMSTAFIDTSPLPPTAVGVVMDYAFCLNSPFDYVSNPVEIAIVP
jgi:hypothetical protein